MKAIKVDSSGSVLIQAGTLQVWVDVWEEDGGARADWNMYIFARDNAEDMRIKTFQESCSNFDMASSLAITALEAHKNK